MPRTQRSTNSRPRGGMGPRDKPEDDICFVERSRPPTTVIPAKAGTRPSAGCLTPLAWTDPRLRGDDGLGVFGDAEADWDFARRERGLMFAALPHPPLSSSGLSRGPMPPLAWEFVERWVLGIKPRMTPVVREASKSAHTLPSSRRRPGPTTSIRNRNVRGGQIARGDIERPERAALLKSVVGPGLRRDDGTNGWPSRLMSKVS